MLLRPVQPTCSGTAETAGQVCLSGLMLKDLNLYSTNIFYFFMVLLFDLSFGLKTILLKIVRLTKIICSFLQILCNVENATFFLELVKVNILLNGCDKMQFYVPSLRHRL